MIRTLRSNKMKLAPPTEAPNEAPTEALTEAPSGEDVPTEGTLASVPKKKQGRGPNKLPEVPTKENRPKIKPAGKFGFIGDDRRPATVLPMIVRRLCKGQESWSDWDNKQIKTARKDFLEYFQWDLDHCTNDKEKEDEEKRYLEVCDAKARKNYKDSLNNALAKAAKVSGTHAAGAHWYPHKPQDWPVLEADWKKLCDIWTSKKWQKKSITNKENRAHGVGPTHVGGPVSFGITKQKMAKETGKEPTVMEVFKRTKMRPTGEWVNPKTGQMMGEFTNKMVEDHGDNWNTEECKSHQMPTWLELHGKMTNGRIPGVHSMMTTAEIEMSQTIKSTGGVSRKGCSTTSRHEYVSREETDRKITEALQKKDEEIDRKIAEALSRQFARQQRMHSSDSSRAVTQELADGAVVFGAHNEN